MKILRTPEECFINLPEFPFTPRYINISAGDGNTLRIHYLDEGPRDGEPFLLIHGEPTWSFLYRKMISILVSSGLRAIVPDLVGFGRSDKPADRSDYTYQSHVDWMTRFLDGLDLQNITLFGQDWGGLIGLRLATQFEDRFSRIIATNTGLPTGEQKMTDAFIQWQQFSQRVAQFPISRVINGGCVNPLPSDVKAAYEAPFPDESFKEGARIFPALVPTTPHDPAVPANLRAWEVLRRWTKPFLTLFSDSDPITARGELILRRLVPGAKGQPHTIIKQAGHFLQEDKGEEIAQLVIDFIERNPSI